jgi:photosystem II stability/assembly factor-like uncharacterized protein
MAVWSDFRTGGFGSYVAYFPDFAMTVDETADTLRPTDTLEVMVNIPAVKLYNNTVEISAEAIPSGIFLFEFPAGSTISSFPGSVPVRIIGNNTASDNYVIRISGKGPNGTPVHVRDIDLLVTNPTTTLVQPNGGETLYVGTGYPIRFEKIFIETIKLEYSTDNGTSWTDIGTTTNDDEFIWVVPNIVSSNCLIRISDDSDPLVSDMSDAVFSIEVGPLPNWRLLSSGVDSSIISVDIVDTLISYAGTKNGRVLKTTDGGETWQNLFTSHGGDVTSIFAVSEQKAFIIVNSETSTRIRRTLSFGASWGTVYEDTSPGAHLNAIHMFDEDNGFAIGNPVGGQWVLLSTTDGGANWSSTGSLSQNGSETGFANSLDWTGNQMGWFGTNNNRVYNTTDGGNSWQPYTTSFTNSTTVSFTDEQNGIASGDATDKSIDGGLTWTTASGQIAGNVVAGSAVKGVDGRWYFIFGNEVYKTYDQGDNFVMDYMQTNNFNSIDVELIQVGENFWVTGYAVGEMGTIAKYVELLLATDVEEIETYIPESYTLKQNFPNPFNPTTTIEFALPFASDVKLSIYNILGQKVITLLNEQRSAGNHSVVWNATDSYGSKLSSGIYFYKLNAAGIDGNEFVDIRKMVLLK